MSIVDVAIIVVVGITALLGLLHGALKSIVSTVAWVLSFVVAFFLANTVAVALLDVPFIANLVCGQSGSLFSFLRDNVPAGLSSVNGLFGGFFKDAVSANALVESGAVSGSDANCLLMAFALFATIVGVVLFALVRVVAAIIVKIGQSINKKISMPKGISRIVGFAVGGFKGVCYVVMIFVFVSVLTVFPFMSFATDHIYGQPEIAAVEKTDTTEAVAGQKFIPESFIGKPLFEFASGINLGMFVGDTEQMGKTLDKLIAGAGLVPAEAPPPAA